MRYLPIRDIHSTVILVNHYFQKLVQTHCGVVEHLELDISQHGKKALSKLRSYILRDRPYVKAVTFRLKSDKNPRSETEESFQSVLECLSETLKALQVADMGGQVSTIGSPSTTFQHLKYLSVSEMDAMLWLSLYHLDQLKSIHVEKLDHLDQMAVAIYQEELRRGQGIMMPKRLPVQEVHVGSMDLANKDPELARLIDFWWIWQHFPHVRNNFTSPKNVDNSLCFLFSVVQSQDSKV